MQWYEKVEKIRQMRGLSPKELVERAGISIATYYHLRTTGKGNIGTLQKISEVLEVSLFSLFTDNNAREAASMTSYDLFLQLSFEQRWMINKLVKELISGNKSKKSV